MFRQAVLYLDGNVCPIVGKAVTYAAYTVVYAMFAGIFVMGLVGLPVMLIIGGYGSSKLLVFCAMCLIADIGFCDCVGGLLEKLCAWCAKITFSLWL